MRIALVYNERLSRKRMDRVLTLARTLEQRGHDVEHVHGDDFEAGRDALGADCIVLAGGDGTARLVIGKQADTSKLPPVAIYPTGTINLLARELGYPSDPVQFAERIETRKPTLTTRLATIDGEPFLACASIGFDAHTVASVSEALKMRIGRFAYVAALLSLVKHWPSVPVTIDTGTEKLTAESLFVLRGKFYAGPWSLDPAANLQQEHLRVLALPRARKRDMLLLALYAMLGSRKPHGKWRFIETDRLTVTGGEGVPVQADGDVVARAPIEFAMTDRTISFL